MFGWPRFILVLITRIKYESGEEIMLGVIRKNNASKKVASEILFWSSREANVKIIIIIAIIIIQS